MWVLHAQVTATGFHISKQCFLLFFLYYHYWCYCYYYHFYKTPLQLVSVFISSISISALQSFVFPFLWKSALMRFLWFSCVGFLWAVLDILHGLVWDYVFFSFFFCYLYICLFSRLDCFDGIKHSFASMRLNAFQHGKLSTTVNSIHFLLHPSCLLFLPVAHSITGFRCQLYCENFCKLRKLKVKMESVWTRRNDYGVM